MSVLIKINCHIQCKSHNCSGNQKILITHLPLPEWIQNEPSFYLSGYYQLNQQLKAQQTRTSDLFP